MVHSSAVNCRNILYCLNWICGTYPEDLVRPGVGDVDASGGVNRDAVRDVEGVLAPGVEDLGGVGVHGQHGGVGDGGAVNEAVLGVEGAEKTEKEIFSCL